jgi:hypothetical protein
MAADVLRTLADARWAEAERRRFYSQERPHSCPGYRTAKAFDAQPRPHRPSKTNRTEVRSAASLDWQQGEVRAPT